MIFHLLLLVTTVPSSFGANILAMLPTPSYSHQVAFHHIWKELSLRGHKVTLITTDPLNDPNLTNLTEIDMKWTYKTMENITKLAVNEFSMWTMHRIGHMLLYEVAKAQLSYPEVQDLIHNQHHFDLVLVEFFFPEFLAFAEIYNCPKILFSSINLYGIVHHYIGNTIHPVLYPEMGATFYRAFSFWERIQSTLYTCYALFFLSHVSYVERTKLMYFNVSQSIHELLSDVDMLFVNVNPIFQPVRAFGPSTINIGDERKDVSSTVLQKDLAEFLDSAVDGFVYFSLGSNVKSKDLSKETLEGITEALREIPYKVLWKFETDEFPNKPENVKLIKWAPQPTVLSHPNIKLFVTQGGLQSLEEAFYRGVPCVVIPFFIDQEQNAKIMEVKSIAVIVNRESSILKEELKQAILEVANNPKYRDTVKKLKQLATDSPMTGLEKAVWWTEYVIRHRGAKHLRNPAADLPLYQYFLVDVIGFILLVLTTISLFLFFLLRNVYNKIKICLFKFRGVPNKKKIK